MKFKSYLRVIYKCSMCNSTFVYTFQTREEIYNYILCVSCQNQCFPVSESLIKRDLQFNTILSLKQLKIEDFK